MKYSDNQMLLEYVKGRVIFCFYIFEDKIKLSFCVAFKQRSETLYQNF